MSCVQNPIQTILGTECIGDSLPKINSNFSVLGTNVCQLLTAVDSFNVVDRPTVDLTFDSYTRTLSADVKDASVTNAKIAFDGGAFAFRNKIINGGFDIWQRGTSFTGIGAGIFTADRWTTSTSTATLNKNISRQTLSNTDLPSTSAGLRYFLRGSYTSGTNTAELPILTPIELTNTGSASPFKVNQTYTLSFYGKCNSSNPIGIRIQHRDVGSGTGSVTPNAVMVLDTTQILDSNWSRYSFTFTMIAPNPTNVCTTVGFVNNTIPTNTNIDITGVQLEEGPTATPFEHRPIGTELSLCQRYYQYIDLANQAWAISNRQETTKNPACITIVFPVKMRAAPLFEYWSTTYGKNKLSLRAADGTELSSMTASHLSVTQDAAMIRSNITTYYSFVVSWVIADADL